jgi:isopenicillin N synthase-like dioxygenase
MGEATTARYSIPYYFLPLPDGAIEPQPSLVASHGKQVYEPVTFNSYSEQWSTPSEFLKQRKRCNLHRASQTFHAEERRSFFVRD